MINQFTTAIPIVVLTLLLGITKASNVTDDSNYTLPLCKGLNESYQGAGQPILGTGKVILEEGEADDNFQFTALDNLRRLQDALAKRGVLLIVLPIPTRAYAFSDRVDKSAFPKFTFSNNKYLVGWKTMLRSASGNDVRIINILPGIDSFKRNARNEDFFYTRDPHWTTSGAEVSAKIAAEYIKKLVLQKGIKLNVTDKVANESRGHDLTGIQNNRYRQACKVSTDDLATYKVDVSDKKADLLSEERYEIGVFGDSFGLTSPDNNFAPFLELYTGAKVINYSAQGGGLFGGLLGYLADPKINANLPKIAIIPVASPISNETFLYNSVIDTLDFCKNKVNDASVRLTINNKITSPYLNIKLQTSNYAKLEFSSRVSNFNVIETMKDKTVNYIKINRYYSDLYRGPTTQYYIPLGDTTKLSSISIKIEDEKSVVDSVSLNLCRS